MSLQSWQETLVSQHVAGTAYNTFTTAQTVISTSSLFTLPANFFTLGKALRLTVAGNISNIVTTPGTITFQVMMGAVIAFTTGAIQLSTTAHTSLPFWLQVLLTCRAVGSGTSTTLMGQATAISQCFALTAVADDTYTMAALMAPATAPAVGTGFDGSAAQEVDFFTGFSISDAGNEVQVQQYLLESLN